MRAMRAEGFGGYQDLKLAEIPKPYVSDGRVLVPDLKVPMAATSDVGGYAEQRPLHLEFSDRQTRELLGERDLSMTEATAVIAHGIGKPDLRYE